MGEVLASLLGILEERARYNRQLFVDRAKEIELVYKMLLDAWEKELQKPVLLFWGIHGMGKTWLMKRLHDRFCFSLDDWKREGRSSFSVLIDLSEHKDDSNLQRVMAAIVREMRSALGPVASELGLDKRVEKLLHALGQELTGLQLQDEADELASLLGALGDKRLVPVLLFDAVERFPKEMRNELEEWIMAPLVRRPDIPLIFAGRGQLEWSRFETQRRSRAYRLAPFNREEIKEKIRGDDLLTAMVGRFSFGHPLTIEAVYEAAKIIAERNGHQLDKTLFESRAKELAEILDEAVVREKFLEGLEDEQRKLLRAVCTLRRVTPTSLKRFATKFVGERYEEQSTAFYLRMLGDFVDSKLVEWSRAAGGHVLDAIARQIMSHNLQLIDPNEFEARHQEAIDMNRQMLANLPDQAVLEILYHLTCLSSMKGQPATELRQSLESEMGLVLREDKLNIDQATNLYEALREDGELERQMGEEIFNSLCQKVKDFRDRLKIA